MQNVIIKNGTVTFELEDLSPPDGLLQEEAIGDILKKFSKRVEAHSHKGATLVNRGHHSFIAGMYHAYAEHRPFTLSPDMIWLLICQGFSNHVNFSHGTEKEVFPELEKQKMVVRDDRIILGNPASPWHEVPSQFTQAIETAVGSDLIDAMRADFSTSDMNAKVACDITIMHTFKEYFDYILVACICGIPKITLEGGTEDWLHIIEKLKKLEKYGLQWWTMKLYPILEEFVKASKGEVNRAFWMNMFKVHTEQSYGAPQRIDGWILHFYPYDRNGKVFNIGSMKSFNVDRIFKELPKEIVVVDFEYQLQGSMGEIVRREDMEFRAGFIGLSQTGEDYGLRPEIGWFVNYADKNTKEIPEDYREYHIVCFHNVKEVPQQLFNGKEWRHVVLNFTGKVRVPFKLRRCKIRRLEINGKMSAIQETKLEAMFAKSDIHLILNGKW